MCRYKKKCVSHKAGKVYISENLNPLLKISVLGSQSWKWKNTFCFTQWYTMNNDENEWSEHMSWFQKSWWKTVFGTPFFVRVLLKGELEVSCWGWTQYKENIHIAWKCKITSILRVEIMALHWWHQQVCCRVIHCSYTNISIQFKNPAISI